MKKFLLFIYSISISAYLSGATITVTNTNDSGSGSLREAISIAAPSDIIDFDPTIAGDTITISSTITISQDISVNGPTTDGITITSNASVRVFVISNGSYTTLSWINFYNNKSSSGGAILNSGILEISYCNFYQNGSLMNNNSHGGGAVYNNTGGTLLIDQCNFEKNFVESGQPAVTNAYAGAIFNKGDTLGISNSYFGENIAIYAGPNPGSARGGAIYSSAKMGINNCTFYGNAAEGSSPDANGYGGAIYSLNILGIMHSTITNNSASGDQVEQGGNIYNGSSITLLNSIFSNSSPSNSNIYNVGVISSLGATLMDDATSSGLSFGSTDILADPLLNSPSNNNNAFTKTVSISCESPAKDAGNSTGALTLDQADQARVNNGTIDIGAYEQHAVKPSVTVTATDLSICEGELTTISATITDPDTYEWDNGLGSGQTFDVQPVVQTTYTVIATNTGGCSDTGSVTISINATPTVSASADQYVVCDGGTINLSASGANTYSWDNGLGSGMNQTPTVSSTTKFIVTGTSIDGCEDTASVTIGVESTPTITLSTDKTVVCQGDSVTMTATGATTYEWGYYDPNSNFYFPSSGATYVIEPYDTITYYLTGDPGSNCEAKDSVEIIYHNAPNPGMSIANDTILTVSGGPYTAIQWYRNDTSLTGETSNNYTAKVNGDFFFEATDNNSCIGKSPVINVSVFGVNGLNDKLIDYLKIYPNPTQSNISIEVKEPSEYIIYNLHGTVVLEGRVDLLENRIDLNQIATGNYIIIVTNKNGSFLSSIIKE